MSTELLSSGLGGATVRPIRRLLVANRGEIALRIMRTANRMGISCIAVYSTADANAMHVRFADDAVCIGEPAPAQSYLNIARIIEAAKATQADAIHPGYGFLAENEQFAQAVADAGLIFVGPGAAAIQAMGDKARAKVHVEQAGLPTIPGYQGEDQSADRLMAEARRVGFPIMIKASSGGGGRGMRRVEQDADFAAALTTAQSEAASAFGDPRVILERALTCPRHVEVQILADQHGKCIHLGERDCSIQRRHQKIVEESPSPAVDAGLRARMGDTAVRIAQSIAYSNAGTIEFLLDQSGEYYFMEMNTRLQVEHPVTEAITGLDLVEEQLHIASGLPLRHEQKSIRPQGHAIEVRLCAEDPVDQFLPQTGEVTQWVQSDLARNDHAIEKGLLVSPWYDSMLAKIIVHADSRQAACDRLQAALRQTALGGLPSNLDFLRRIASHPAFMAGDTSTAFIEQHYALATSRGTAPAPRLLAAAAVYLSRQAGLNALQLPPELHGFCSTGPLRKTIRLQAGTGANSHEQDFTVQSDEQGHTVSWRPAGSEEPAQVRLSHHACAALQSALLPVRQGLIHVHHAEGEFAVWDTSLQPRIKIDPNAFVAEIKSPMNGRVVAIKANAGDTLQAKSVCIILEAMKMEHSLTVPTAACVDEVCVGLGQQVAPGQALLKLKPIATTEAP
jgi:geranyl-CoA carboxylase alpha subunit